MIEKGRHKCPITTREQRFCPTCPTIGENEVRFLPQCSSYANKNDRFAAIEKEVSNFVNLNVQAHYSYGISRK